VQEGVDPARGTVVDVSGNFRGIAWIYDDFQVFVIPLSGRSAKHRLMAPHPRRDICVVGRLSTDSLAYMREIMADAIAANTAPDDWEGAALDYFHVPLPADSEGWTPISMVDGSYWRLPTFARGF
jgi:hypothetical protein